MSQSNDIKEYLRSNRKGKAANRLERKALSDPFLYEALEGLSQISDPIDGLIRLERQINDQANSQNCVWKWAWGMVASVAVVVGIALWFIWPVSEVGQEVILAEKAQGNSLSEQKLASLQKAEVSDTLKSDTNRVAVHVDVASVAVTKVKKEVLSDKDSVNKAENSAVKSSPEIRRVAKPEGKVNEEDSIMLDNINRFNTYVEKELRYPKEDLKEGNEGEIRLSFEINSKGVPSRIRIARGFSYPGNDEIIRLLVNGPRWKTIQGDKNRIDVIVRFKLGKEGKKNSAVLRLADVN